MSRTTGPILAVGAIALVNQSIVNDEPIHWRIPVGTAIAAGGFSLLENLWEEGAVALSWLALISILFVRLEPTVPAPVEGLMAWWNKG